MRALFAVLLTWYCAASLSSAELKGRSPLSFQSCGQEYVSLQDWAEANQFVFSRKDDEVRLTNRWTRLHFKVTSQRAEMNGVAVFLAFPVVQHQGTVGIAQRDLDRTLKPILYPAKSKQPIKVIALSAGHGGKDCGYQVGTQQEKKFTLLLAKELQRLVNRAGFKTVLVRGSDKTMELEDRTLLAKRGKADLFVELHYNSAGPGNTETRGVEVYCLTPPGANSTNGGSDPYAVPLTGNRHDEKNILLAYKVHSALVGNMGLVDRGVRRARFVVLREAEMPAVLIEGGFMSNPDEMRKIQDPIHRRQTAQAILDGLLAYKRSVEH